MAAVTLHPWRRGVMRAARAAGVLAGGVALGSIGVAYYVARALTGPSKAGPTDDFVMTPFETGAEFEEVAFRPERGDYVLRGWWFPRPGTQRVIIGCPGYRGSKSDLLGIATRMWHSGFNLFIFDYRGHGSDRGTPVTLAYREMADFFGALNYVLQRMPDAQVGVLGYSMGASVAIMGAARRPEVRAVVADSPFSTHADIVSYRVSQVIHLPGRPIADLTDHLLPYVAGYHFSDVMPLRDVAAIAPRPLLIIHGTADTAIPVRHARLVYAAAGEPKELWLAEGAQHCGAYFQDRAAYCARVSTFFAEHLAETARPPEKLPAGEERLLRNA